MVILWAFLWITYIVNFFIACLYIKQNANILSILNRLYPGICAKIYILQLFIKAYISQWLRESVVKININEYELNHIIEGRLVKIRVKRIIPNVIDVQDRETEESYFDKYDNYLHFKQVLPFDDKQVIYYYEDGTCDIN